MDEKDDIVYINHILDAISNIEDYIKDINKANFLKDKKTQSAVIREISVIGEATSLISAKFESMHGGIPWKEMKGTRNRVVHGYFSVDLNLVWEIAVKDLPELKKNLEPLIRK